MSEYDLLKIIIQDHEGIEEMATKPFPQCTAIISICDSDITEYDFPTLVYKPDYLLQLRFDDVVMESDGEGLNSISNEQAISIALYVKSILGKADTLICQCEYGQSRSPAIAAAISEFLYQNSVWVVFSEEKYTPNRTVFNKVYKALQNNIRGDENNA